MIDWLKKKGIGDKKARRWQRSAVLLLALGGLRHFNNVKSLTCGGFAD